GAAILGQDVAPPTAIDASQIGLLAIYAIAGMALSQVLFIATVGRLGIAVASFHINIAPFYVMLILLGLGSDWSWPQAIGATIVGVGVILSQRR
ncbi:MAG: EamA family transporter, partial [Proteobacteria bacterium]|nr:EamA family transporter [Pseudomonadota bacterium]